MKEFTIGGDALLRQAFAWVLGVPHLNLLNPYFHFMYLEENPYCGQSTNKADTHFELPAQWDEAMAYARRFYGMDKPEGSHLRLALLQQLEDLSEYLPAQVYTRFVIKAKEGQPKEEEKPPLPESWDELAATNPPIEPISEWFVFRCQNDANSVAALTKLHYLKQAYWNAHDGWGPDWANERQRKFCIHYVIGTPPIRDYWETQHFLAFPTIDQAEHFLKHHKALIEQARELL